MSGRRGRGRRPGSAGLIPCGEGPTASLRPGLQLCPLRDRDQTKRRDPMLTLNTQPRSRSCCERLLTAVGFLPSLCWEGAGRLYCDPVGPGLPASFEGFALSVHS